jgi:hypothetical protein
MLAARPAGSQQGFRATRPAKQRDTGRLDWPACHRAALLHSLVTLLAPIFFHQR